MNLSQFTSADQLRGAIQFAEMIGQPVSQEMRARLSELEKQEGRRSQAPISVLNGYDIVESDTPIYDTLIKYAKFPVTQEKRDCVEGCVEHLLEDGSNAEEPCLLLGKIQCGKTDTFENIIGLCFDRGIDIAVVLTKGTNALSEQTVKRFENDYKPFKPTDSYSQKAVINVCDIMDIYTGLKRPEVDGKKTVVVCKKETINMQHLIELFKDNSPFLLEKKVLIVDDEADFASRNYKNVRLERKTNEEGRDQFQKSEIELAKISEQIDTFRSKIGLAYCRYLQVTATPYCLYLQPNGDLFLKNGHVKSFRPRYTAIVPVHKAYIGGEQYYVESKDENSMYSHLFHAVSQKCVKVLKHKDARYLKDSVASMNIYDLRHCILSYLIGTAIRCIQMRENENRQYRTSALIHLAVDKEKHNWQEDLINKLVNVFGDYFKSGASDERLDSMVAEIYDDFVASNKKGFDSMDSDGRPLVRCCVPDKNVVIEELKKIFEEESVNIQVVNSDNMIRSLLDEDGQLKLKATANIFIGGSILDRGITIANMISFFYGRDPKTFQQDTVLQHARMYGSRSKEDMTVTRLYTTDDIYQIFVRMHNLDEQLRQWFIEGKNQDNPDAVFVGYDSEIKPCSPQKIKASNAITLKANKFMLPIGMWTQTKTESKDLMREIDYLITSSPCYNNQDANGFFEMERTLVIDILQKIKSMYIYENDPVFNKERKSDMDELICALDYCSQKSGDKLWALHRVDRNMSRIRQNGAYQDAPHDGRTDAAPARIIAVDKPVIMFLRQNGEKAKDEKGFDVGWNGAPFYWPVFLPQNNLNSVMFAIDTARSKYVAAVDLNEVLEDIAPDDVLKLTFSGDLVDYFGEEGKEYGSEDDVYESRLLKQTVASKYIEKDLNGEWRFANGISVSEDKYHNVYTLNKGRFPFMLRPYKYLLLRNGRNAMSTVMLLELTNPIEWGVEPLKSFNDAGDLVDVDKVTGEPLTHERILLPASDVLVSKNMTEKDFQDKNVCLWRIDYKIKKVVKVRQCKYVDYDNEEDDDN